MAKRYRVNGEGRLGSVRQVALATALGVGGRVDEQIFKDDNFWVYGVIPGRGLRGEDYHRALEEAGLVLLH